MRITKRQLRRVIRESIRNRDREDQIVSAYDSGATDAEEGYDAGSYHDWIDGDEELMASYDRGYEDGSGMEEIPDRRVRSREQLQTTYGDMDVGVRGKAGY
jgi:hypothetical protein